MLSDAAVRGVFQFEVAGHATPDGVVLKAVKGCRIEGPVPRAKRKSAPEGEGDEVDEDEGEGDEVEPLFPGHDNEDDISDDAVVDTDADSDPESSSSSSDEDSDSDDSGLAKPLKAHLKDMTCIDSLGLDDKGSTSNKSDCKKAGPTRNPPLWDNKYFYIADNDGHPDLKVLMHSYWAHAPPGGMGMANRSKTITPRHYGESREQPVRSMILLRAWVLHRVQVGGWAHAAVGRARQFEEEAVVLQQDIQKLQPQVGGLLGHAVADELLMKWAPAVVNKLI